MKQRTIYRATYTNPDKPTDAGMFESFNKSERDRYAKRREAIGYQVEKDSYSVLAVL